jgi:hypothetical protein
MNVNFNKFIEYFFSKYYLEPSFLKFGIITFLFILFFLLFYLMLSDVKNNAVMGSNKIKGKRYQLWKNQYFMTVYLSLLTVIIYNFALEFDVINKKQVKRYDGDLIYDKELFVSDLKSSKVLEGLTTEQEEKVKKEIILAIYGETENNKIANLFYEKGNIKLAPITLKEVKSNLEEYREGKMKALVIESEKQLEEIQLEEIRK